MQGVQGCLMDFKIRTLLRDKLGSGLMYNESKASFPDINSFNPPLDSLFNPNSGPAGSLSRYPYSVVRWIRTTVCK